MELYFLRTGLVSNEFPATDNVIRPGDVILIYHDNTGQFKPYDVWLDHTVMFIDVGLILEKSGSGNTTPFRLIDYNTFEASWGDPGSLSQTSATAAAQHFHSQRLDSGRNILTASSQATCISGRASWMSQ